MLDSFLFKTPRLVLRPVKPKDFEFIFKWENDQDNWIQSGITEPYSREDIKQYVARSENLEKDGQTRLIIALKDGTILGCVDLFEFDAVWRSASVGVLIDQAYRRKGFATETLQALMKIAAEHYRLKKLKALILANNNESLDLFQKVGFTKELTEARDYSYQSKLYKQFAYFKNL